MKCDRFKRYMVDYFAGELGGAKKEEMEKHLESCSSCRRDFADYKAVFNNARLFHEPVHDMMFWENRLREVLSHKREKKPALKLVFALSAAAAILLAVVFKYLSVSVPEQKIAGKGGKTLVVKRSLPYSEERLLEMANYLDEKSAAEMLDILVEKDVQTFSSYNNYN